ncbi:Pyruvate dehydrogenase complex protein X component [Yarrowia sp. B02]|nr:Pyruvate dehydrogenase complex protein X component [Yarrowia sp. B02]
MNRLLRVIPRARLLHTKSALYQASNFAMPAMSPTMTEGGIVSWKVKEGDEFSAGDVILEIETDKAQIDVEAADDGVMARIYKQDGAKDIQVGDTIAVIAEPGDDINTIEIPAPVESDGAPAPKEEAKEEPKEAPKQAAAPAPAPKKATPAPKAEAAPASSSDSYSAPANPKQTLLPSVSSLLVANNISKEDAFANIPATGPHGRLLKGDVLAYIGAVPKGYPGSVADEINKRSHLDLSNVKPAKKSDAAPAETKDAAAAAPEKPKAPEPVILTKEISTVGLPDVVRYINALIGVAKDDVVRAFTPKKSAIVDPLFEEIIGPAKGTTFYMETVHYPTPRQTNGVAPGSVRVEVKVNYKVPGAEKRAQLFLEKLKEHVEAEEFE